eukprot:178777_1
MGNCARTHICDNNFHRRDHTEQENKVPQCNRSISECDHFKDLFVLMNSYMDGAACQWKLINIANVVNNHLHLLQEHDDDFEFIHSKINLTNCNVLKCDVFMRAHRNRNRNELNQNVYHTNDVNTILKAQILDKIHCHYAHSFDIGHSVNVKTEIDLEDDHEITTLMNVLREKHQTYRQIQHKLGKSTQSKFITTITNTNDNDTELNEYSFGVQFVYDDFGVSRQNVHNKYKSFKVELTRNEKARLSLIQFRVELKKAKTYFNSWYYRRILINKNLQNYEDYQAQLFDITAEHILSVLVYCNFDYLQREFSKTYRPLDQVNKSMINLRQPEESAMQSHSEFYFLGKYLKEAVHGLGEEISSGKVRRFYHGIHETLTFPLHEYNCIKAPLSTSSSMPVAIRFTENQGLMVELAYNSGFTFQLSVSWCSDFPSEREHLFIQNQGGLKFINIINVQTGYGFKLILGAINLLNSVYYFMGSWDYMDEKSDDSNGKILAKLMRHEAKIAKFTGLDVYAEQLFHRCCMSIELFQYDWIEMKNNFNGIHQVLKSDKFDGINIGVLNALHPKLKHIVVYNISINRNTYMLLLDDIWTHFKQKKDSQIHEIELDVRSLGKCDVAKFEAKFSKIGFYIGREFHESIFGWEIDFIVIRNTFHIPTLVTDINGYGQIIKYA